mgnify:CR=1 FL=1
MMTDPIADMLTRIRNANIAYHEEVDIPASRMKEAVARILKKEGFIRDFKFIKTGNQGILRIGLKYGSKKERAILGIKRVSRPGLRVYVQAKNIPSIYGGRGKAILSTSRGVMSGEQAKKKNLGGELICYIW